MTAREIVTQWLSANGYDGLYADGECACLIDDLAPCCEDFSNCKAGYKAPCTGDDCPLDGDCAWHVQGEKPEEE